eukprot:scaffold7168_cov182-Amphora_coffeaeformis.AAC.9
MMLMRGLVLCLLPATTTALWTPTRISFAALQQPERNSGAVLRDALSDVGLVSLTDIAPDFGSIKRDMMQAWVECTTGDDVRTTHHPFFQDYVFGDGTLRRTWATGSQGREETVTTSEACQRFITKSQVFRDTVQSATETFAVAVQRAWQQESDSNMASLITRDPAKTYQGLDELVRSADHLEHFHAYSRLSGQEPEDHQGMTIDWHTDQGLFLVFSPGVIHDTDNTEGLYIQFRDGSKDMVQFDAHQDDLIVLMGDALQQALSRNKRNGDSTVRVPPHALRVSQMTTKAPRVWYGCMVLPPADALVPMSPQHQDNDEEMTYGELRQAMLEAHNSNDQDSKAAAAIGCSSPTMQARHLETVDCDPDLQFFCWHRCFNLTDGYENATECEAQGLDLACINDQRQLWNQKHDKNFYPGCIDLATAEVAPIPDEETTNVPQTPSPVDASSAPGSALQAIMIMGGALVIMTTWATTMW